MCLAMGDGCLADALLSTNAQCEREALPVSESQSKLEKRASDMLRVGPYGRARTTPLDVQGCANGSTEAVQPIP